MAALDPSAVDPLGPAELVLLAEPHDGNHSGRPGVAVPGSDPLRRRAGSARDSGSGPQAGHGQLTAIHEPTIYRDKPVRIGITGHSNLAPDSVPLVTEALRHAVEKVRVGAGRPLIGVTCLARGADQLFARAVLELGGQIEVVLPASDYG
ncbi:MAG TPA: hypothetical protein VNP03_01485, partial [Pseudonocardia sp.]|nr:hypothetical protein [Pseudonocardia sp.]